MELEQRLKNAIATGASSLEIRTENLASKLMRYDWRFRVWSDLYSNDICEVIFEVPVREYEVIRSRKSDLEEVISNSINEAAGSDCYQVFVVKLNQKWVDYDRWRSGVYPGDEVVRDFLSVIDLPSVKECWEKALERRLEDPSGALTSSSTLLEYVIAHILDSFGEKDYEGKDIPDRYKLVKKWLKIDPDHGHSEERKVNASIKGILGSCNNIVCGIGFLRNKLGDAHPALEPAPGYASLAVNLSGAMAVFLLETLEDRKRRGLTQAED